MLRVIRIGASIVLFTLISFYFIDFRGVLPDFFQKLTKIQFIPALSAGGILILGIILSITLLFGRIYCSSICPMGIFQDITGWLSKRLRSKKKRKKYTFSPAKTKLRWGILVVAIIAYILNGTILFGLIEPYSAYGRMAVHLFKPLYLWGNNLLAAAFPHIGSVTLYKVDVILLSVSSLIVASGTLLIIGFLAWKNGRTFCNTICPVGTILGALSKYSFFKIRINTEKCNHCSLCATKCKASCINSKEQVIDYSRCVDCFDCLGSCKQGALSYSFGLNKKKIKDENSVEAGQSRRLFLATATTTAIAIPTVFAQNKMNQLSGEKITTRKTPISPPGAKGARHLLKHCTSCHLCISKCPSKVIKPAFLEYGIGGLMQPMMCYENGFCNYDCTVCADVCPNEALHQLSVEKKHRTQIGRVVFVEGLCIVHTEGTNCGACSEHCPTQAVKMERYKDGLTIPVINPDICIGCGGCEFICPVRPHRAIFVEGNAIHQEAQVIIEEKQEDIKVDEFGF